MQFLPMAERMARRALMASGFESRWVETKLANHHLYDVRGRGRLPTVVLLHGISSAAMAFASVIQRLRPHVRRVLAPEAPGHGFSGQPTSALTPDSLFETMAELLDRELDEPAILVGNSLGGGVALSYAMERPERVKGLFLTSPAGAGMTPLDFEQFLRTLDLRSTEQTRAFLDRIYHKTPWLASLLAPEIQRQFSRELIRSFTAASRAEDLFRPEELSSLQVPVHLLWGRSERLMPAANLEFFRRHLPPSATIEEPEGMGHCPHLDAPGALVKKILAFARRLPVR